MLPYHRNIFRTRYFFRQQAAKERNTREHWLLDYLKKNPIQSGLSLATLYGIVAIFAYHSHIDYFPSFDIKSLASTILAAAYTTLLTLVAFSVGLIAPCFGGVALAIDAKTRKDRRAFTEQIVEYVIAGFFTFLSLCLGFLGIVDGNWSPAYLFLIFPGLLILLSLRPLVQSINASVGGNQPPGFRWEELWRQLKNRSSAWFRLVKAVLGIAIMQFTTMIIIFVILRDSPLAQGKNVQWLPLFNFIVISGLLLHAVIFYLLTAWFGPGGKLKHRVFSVALALIVPIFTSLFAGNTGFFFSYTAMTTKIGNFRAAELTLTDTGCQILANSASSMCSKLADGSNKLCNVHVMSRLGTETYLLVSYPHAQVQEKVSKTEGDKDVQRPEWVRDVYIPSKEILGMKVDTSKRYYAMPVMERAMGKETSQCIGVPKPAGTPNKAEKTFDGAQLFAFDLYSLTPSGQKMLGEFSQRLIDGKSSTMSIKVVGHADAIGNDYHNLQLSQLRALTVANYLQAQLNAKVKNLKVEWLGVGSSQKKTADDACPIKAKQAERVICLEPDRRVEITASWSNEPAARP